MAYGVGVAVGLGVGVTRGTGGAVGSGVASGSTEKVASGTSELCASGRGVTIAVAPLGVTEIVASVRAGTSEPASNTKFLPWRKICQRL